VHGHGSAGPERPRLEVADIVRIWGADYRAQHTLSSEQARVLRAIERCRTAALGGHLDVCDCGFERPAYNSCRDRHCPKCQGLAQARWVARRLERILPVPYFHVVFTLPAELRALVRANRALLFELLFQAVSATLLQLGADPRHLGAQIGFTALLHTWTRTLEFHPHLHCIVTGGGRDAEGHWRPVRGGARFFIPVRVLARLFRGKFLHGLRELHRARKLRFTGPAEKLAADDVFAAFVDRLYRRDWVVYAKRPFAGPQQVFRYLGLYSHRVGISNHRLQAIDEDGVRFATRDGKSETLPGPVFIHRFLQHVLPARFVKIRHYGLLASANLPRLQDLQCQLAVDEPPHATPASPPATATWPEQMLALTGVDLRRCPRCGGQLQRRSLTTIAPRPPPGATP
jgi:hypothetical protein